jgi:acetylglutamate kinase
MSEILVVKYGGNAMKSLELRRAVALEIARLWWFMVAGR